MYKKKKNKNKKGTIILFRQIKRPWKHSMLHLVE